MFRGWGDEEGEFLWLLKKARREKKRIKIMLSFNYEGSLREEF